MHLHEILYFPKSLSILYYCIYFWYPNNTIISRYVTLHQILYKKFKQFCPNKVSLSFWFRLVSVIKKKGENNYFDCKFLKFFSLHLAISSLVFVFQNVKD